MKKKIAVVHLPPLLGAPASFDQTPTQVMKQAITTAIKEALLFQSAGFEAVILENFGDVPFFPEHAPVETVTALSVVVAAVVDRVKIPVGVNLLRNDSLGAHAVALAGGADFIRVNVLSGVAATDQGIISGKAAQLLREKSRLSSSVQILADVQVKHARSLSGSGQLALEFEEVMDRAGGDGVIVTGATTGRGISSEYLREAAQAGVEVDCPWWVGSGVNADTVREILTLGGGFIVSSALRVGGKAGNPIDVRRLKQFVLNFKRSSSKRKPPVQRKPVAKRG